MRLGNQQISAAYLGSAQLTEIYLGASPVLGAGGAPADTTPPVFTSGDTATPIAENSGAGQTVYTAAATDDSLPVTYSLKATGDHAAFSINASTGAVTLTANPDYETQASYSFTVIATDAAGNASEQAVTLSITDVDEAAPTLVSAAVNGTSLVLTYSESLATPGPAASAFSVSGATTAAQTPSGAVVSGATVTLTLPTTAAYGQTITVNYTVPGTNPTRDAAGNNAAALTAQAVTNSTPSVFAELFSSGQQGAWYDPSDFSALYQDAAGTVPVTAVGQPVGKAVDKSGRGNHATQATATARPVVAEVSGKRSLTIDKADDRLIVTVPAGGWVGTMVLATDQGTQAYAINLPAGSADIGGIGGLYFPGSKLYGVVLRNGAMTDSQIVRARAECIANGAGDAYAGVSSLFFYWRGYSFITSFPAINTSSCTNFSFAWYSCSSLTTFPAINTSSVTLFNGAWQNCSSLASFPAIDTSAGTNLSYAWYGCSSLVSFPANVFDNCPATNFLGCFQYCGLSQTSVDNILVSINAAGRSNGTLNINGGTSAAPSATGAAAKSALQARGWTVTTN